MRRTVCYKELLFLLDLPINIVIEKAIPSFLKAYTIYIERYPELESDSKFNN